VPWAEILGSRKALQGLYHWSYLAAGSYGSVDDDSVWRRHVDGGGCNLSNIFDWKTLKSVQRWSSNICWRVVWISHVITNLAIQNQSLGPLWTWVVRISRGSPLAGAPAPFWIVAQVCSSLCSTLPPKIYTFRCQHMFSLDWLHFPSALRNLHHHLIYAGSFRDWVNTPSEAPLQLWDSDGRRLRLSGRCA